ncbi:glycosyltransferase [Vibrio maritimus]|uniref:Glycosyltransferase n=1 Tax=Vibrio maritimus TaxID=990268 RepID=A0A090S6H3_9VIBR|nr:glycosyltransferase [Vibrio maritimus]
MGKCLGIPVVYDIYDKYTASREIKGTVGWLFDKLEMLAVNTSNHTILPDVSRYKQFGISTTNSDVTIIENVPMYSTVPTSKTSLDRPKEVSYVLCYVGILEPTHRGLEDLLKVVSTKPGIQLYIAGFGPLEAKVIEYAEKHSNIRFLGEVDRTEAFHIMQQSDIHVGMYYKTVSNHYYAAPNKYYEHLYFGKPLITTQGTPPGSRVEDLSTGWAISEGESNISSCLDNLDPIVVSGYSSNARKQWDNKYSQYKEYFYSTYLSIVDELLFRKNEC